jgi:two-component system, cell cycle response regulator
MSDPFESKYDPKVIDQGWALFGRESMFTKMVLDMRSNRQKFKETKQQHILDKSRHTLTEEKIEEFERVGLRDKLTDLCNPRAFGKKLQYELRRAKRYKRPLSLLVVAVDNLDEVGRTYGQLAIDDTIRSAANICRAAIRDVDVAARCSPDKLAIIFPETYSSRAIVVGERIREKMKGTQINEDLRQLRVTASVGVVSFPTHARDEQDLLNRALEFLRIAQSEGGDRVHNG